MASDSKLPVAIFAALAVLIAIPFLYDFIRESRRPVLLDARVVTATESDPVFREGRRRPRAGEEVEAAVALRFGRAGKPGRWLAPVGRLAIEGIEVEHDQTDAWPDTGRAVRVLWFSVEGSNLGGSLNAENAADRLRYRTFLAPEMGRNLRADGLPETHNDDHIGEQSTTAPDGAGTFRLYARIEIVENDSDPRPLQAVTTAGTASIFEPGFPTISKSGDIGEAIDPSVGELFGLPGFEPRSENGAWNEVTVPAFRRTFTELVSERMVVSSWTLAAVAIAGDPNLDPGTLSSLGDLLIRSESVVRQGQKLRKLRWGVDVRPGDLLVDGNHWWVLLGDNGDDWLDPADHVLHCWGRPPERTTIFATLETETTNVEHRRYEP